jgi:hypothetical protein
MRYSKDKDIVALRETQWAKDQAKHPCATLKDYSLKHPVTIKWDMNDEAKRDQMFVIRIGDTEALLDYEEFQRAARFI